MQRRSRSQASCSNSRILLYLVIILINMIKLKSRNFRVVLKWCVAIGTLGVVIYPIILSPMIDPSEYKKLQKIGRAGIEQEKIQPGNMKVWSDPFKSSK